MNESSLKFGISTLSKSLTLFVFSGSIIILFFDLAVSASFALIDEWIYQFETVMLGLAVLCSPFACFLGFTLGNKIKDDKLKSIQWSLIMLTAIWRLLTSLNHLSGAAYYDVWFMFMTYFVVPISLFTVTLIITHIMKTTDSKFLNFLPFAGILIAALFFLFIKNLAYYFAITGNLLLLFLVIMSNSKNSQVKEEQPKNESKKNEDSLIRDNLNINGLVLLMIVSSLFVGLNFWNTAKITIFSINDNGFFGFHFTICAIGSLITAISIKKIKKFEIFRLFTSFFLAILLVLFYLYYYSTESNILEISLILGTILSPFFSGYAITLLLLSIKGISNESTKNRKIALMFLSFGFVFSQIGFLIAFYQSKEQITKDTIFSTIIILTVLGILAALFGGRWNKLKIFFEKLNPKEKLQANIPCILIFGLIIGNIIGGSLPIGRESVPSNMIQPPIPATSIFNADIYNYDSEAFRSPFGSCTHNDETSAIIEDHKAAGFGWWRKDWTWGGFQKENSSDWHFEEFDRLVQHFNANDMYMIPLVSYVPKWACNNSGKYCEQLLEEWKTFIRTIVSRYAGNKSITCWEIWNEPNINSEIFYDPYIYSLLLIEASKIIRDLDPKSLILAGGTSSMNLGNWGWYKKLFELNTTGPEEVKGKIDFDVINLHLYQQSYRGALYEIMEIRNLADSYSFTVHSSGRGAIWITETGKVTKEENWPDDHLYQAEFLSKVAVSSLYSGVAKIFYYVWFGEQYFGIMYSEHKGKPAYYHLQTIHHLLMNAKPIPIQSNPSVTREARVLPQDQDSLIKIKVKGYNGLLSPNLHIFPFESDRKSSLNNENKQIALILWLDGSSDLKVSFKFSEKNNKIKEITKVLPSEVLKWPPKDDGWLKPAQNLSIAPTETMQIKGTLPHYFVLMLDQANTLELEISIIEANSISILLGVSIGLIVAVNLPLIVDYLKRQTKSRQENPKL